MAVTVVTARYNTLAPRGREVIAEATEIEVKEGHLHVGKLDNSWTTALAVYAPGQWISASRDDSLVFQAGE